MSKSLTKLELLKLGLRNTEDYPLPANQSVQDKPLGEKHFFWTTKEVVNLLNLSSAEPLYRARMENRIYRQDNRVVCPAGRNKWEVFHPALPDQQDAENELN